MSHLSLHRPQVGLIGALAIAAIALFPLTAAAAPGTTRWVNDDKPVAAAPGMNCNKPGYSTIQAAVTAALPGDTVRVCAGTYAGAVVDRAVNLRGDHGAVIDSGPFSHPGLFRAGFLFNPDRSGSGASIDGFTFVGTPQYAPMADDGKLDFAIFSRGSDDVTVRDNQIQDTLQAITTHNGTGWTIEHNDVEDLWTRCGGGIGIIVGGNNGVTSVEGNVVAHNDVSGSLMPAANDCGGVGGLYDGTGIVLYADFRAGPLTGVPALSGNTVEHNKVSLTSTMPELVDVNGIELTDTRADDLATDVVTGNVISHNHVDGAPRNGILVSAGAIDNDFLHNKVNGATEFSCRDDSVGAGSEGTANLWDKNKGDTPSSPPGICD